MTITKQSLLEASKTIIGVFDSNWTSRSKFYELVYDPIEALRQAVQDAEIGDAMQERELQDEPK